MGKCTCTLNSSIMYHYPIELWPWPYKQMIRGIAYRCKTCPDFELCCKCYHRREVLSDAHPDHAFAQIGEELRSCPRSASQDRGPEIDTSSSSDSNDSTPVYRNAWPRKHLWWTGSDMGGTKHQYIAGGGNVWGCAQQKERSINRHTRIDFNQRRSWTSRP